jgi:hypothetical protein
VLGEERETKENEGELNFYNKRNEKGVKVVEGYLKGNVQKKVEKAGVPSLIS